jgi:tetratricopeptide (TPR) repeat protein
MCRCLVVSSKSSTYRRWFLIVALELDRNYSLPYLGLANAYIPMALTSGMPSWQVFPKAKEATGRAVEIDPGDSAGYETLGLISLWYEWNWQEAEKYYQRALDLDPKNAEAHYGYAHLLSISGNHGEITEK